MFMNYVHTLTHAQLICVWEVELGWQTETDSLWLYFWREEKKNLPLLFCLCFDSPLLSAPFPFCLCLPLSLITELPVSDLRSPDCEICMTLGPYLTPGARQHTAQISLVVSNLGSQYFYTQYPCCVSTSACWSLNKLCKGYLLTMLVLLRQQKVSVKPSNKNMI